jgi:tetratricopeptide (TPR) repeat protein
LPARLGSTGPWSGRCSPLRRLSFILGLAALLAAGRAPVPAYADTGWARATFHQAETLAAAGHYEQALALYQQIIAREPSAKLSYCRAGTAAAGAGSLSQAIGYYQTCERLLPDAIEPRAELVKLYQIVGDIAARDQERDGLLVLHKTTDDPQIKATDHYLRDIFAVGALNVAAWEYFDLVGDWPSRYRFFVLAQDGSTAYTIALSSSTAANANAAKILGHSTKEWIFHLDLEQGNTITTMRVFEGEPTYDTIKPFIIGAIRQQEIAKKP